MEDGKEQGPWGICGSHGLINGRERLGEIIRRMFLSEQSTIVGPNRDEGLSPEGSGEGSVLLVGMDVRDDSGCAQDAEGGEEEELFLQEADEEGEEEEAEEEGGEAAGYVTMGDIEGQRAVARDLS